MAKEKTDAQRQSYEKKVIIDSENSVRKVEMEINHLPLSREAFVTELKDEFGKLRNHENEYVNVEVRAKGKWAFSLGVAQWEYVTGEGYRIEYAVPEEDYEDTECATFYWNFHEDLDGVIEIFYKGLCEEEDPTMVGIWEKDTDEADEEDVEDELSDYENKYEEKFGEKFDESIFDNDMLRRIDAIVLCLDKGKTFREKEIVEYINAENESYEKARADYERKRSESKAKVKALLEAQNSQAKADQTPSERQ